MGADAAEERIQNAVEMSRRAALLRKLPQGSDPVLVGSVENIGQGQRQLLTIAPAFVAASQDLDSCEAPSNVNIRTEKAIRDAMQRILQERTVS